MSTPTAYDTVPYPTMVFRICHPDALATIARLHGIPAPAVETARVLDIGGGDGLHSTAIAAAFPRAEVVNFDLAAEPITRGRAWAEAAGIANVRHHVLDIMSAADELGGPFDYITAHGIYSWVPEPVRQGLWQLIGRLLSPNGVAFVSYNAMPGGHTRLALREMMLDHVGHLAAPAERLAAARRLLQRFAQPQEHDGPVTAAMRKEAQATLTYADGLLYHDQLGETYAPQRLADVVEGARAQGLRYMGEVGRGGLDRGFVDPDRADIDDTAFVSHLQARDYTNGRYFRSSLFVRAEAPLQRALQVDAARAMWASTQATRAANGQWRIGDRVFTPDQPGLAPLLERLTRYPAPVTELAIDPEALTALSNFSLSGLVDLQTTRPAYAQAAGERPCASPLARWQAASAQPKIATLDQRLIPLDDPTQRALLPLLDGTRDRTMLVQAFPGQPIEPALAAIAREALLQAPTA